MGIPVKVDFSVLFLVGLMLWYTFDVRYLMDSLNIGVYLSVVLLVSILLHELAHSAVALAFGGRVRDITLQVLGGCAAIAKMPPKPWQECLMAVAGPLCSFALAALFYLLAGVVFPVEETFAQDLYSGVVYTHEVPNFWLEMVAFMNLGLGAFNMIPAFPMDGGRILRALLQVVARVGKVKATAWAVYLGRCVAVLWAVLCVLEVVGVSLPRPEGMPWAVAFCWDILFRDGSVLLLLIAYMIWVSGMRELQYVRYEAYYGVNE